MVYRFLDASVSEDIYINFIFRATYRGLVGKLHGKGPDSTDRHNTKLNLK
jgi:hypothetical protein